MDNKQYLKFTENTKFEDLDINLSCNQIHIDKSSIGKNDDEKIKYNFLAVGRSNKDAKKLIAHLANNGFFLTYHNKGVSVWTKFVQQEAENFLLNFEKGTLLYNDTFYTLEEPIKKIGSPKLLVIFSSIADFPFNASISRRMFFKNFPHVSNFLLPNTYILRIADLGGVLGSFYLPSNFDKDFDKRVNALIEKIINDYKIDKEDVVLYGSSKGATGAFYHSVNSGYKSLCIDPIVSDKFYLENYNDLHFVNDVFPRAKEDIFNELMEQNKNSDLSHIRVMTAKSSEQYEFVKDIIINKNNTLKTTIFNDNSIRHTNIVKKEIEPITNYLIRLFIDPNQNNVKSVKNLGGGIISLKTSMNILFSCDNRLYKYIPSLMASLYENHPNTKIDIYLMHSTLKVDEIKILKDFANSYKQEFFEILVDNNDFECFKKVDERNLNLLFPVEAYYHFLAHEYLPLSVERILYLDIDTICAKNIINWYNTDFSNHFYVAPYSYYHKIVKDSEKMQVFNSGVFLMNINKFRQEGINKDFYKRNVELLQTDDSYKNNIVGDQEFIAYVFKDREGFVYIKQDENARINYQPIWNKKEMLDNKFLENLGVIHLNSHVKPWRFFFHDDRFINKYLFFVGFVPAFNYQIITENVLYIFNLFWKYSKSSPFYKELLDKALARTDELARNLPYFGRNKKISMLHEANLISSNFNIPIYDDYNFTLQKGEDFIELKVQYYIQEQWIIFKLPFNPKKETLLEFEINCEYKTKEKIYLFLSDIDGKTQHLPVIDSNQYCRRIVCNSDNYRFLCLSSNSFKTKGDYIRFYSIVVKSIYEF